MNKLIATILATAFLSSCSLSGNRGLSGGSDSRLCLPSSVKAHVISVNKSRAIVTTMRQEDKSYITAISSFHLQEDGSVVQALFISGRVALIDPNSLRFEVPIWYNPNIIAKGIGNNINGLFVRQPILPGCTWKSMKISGGTKT